MKLETYNNQTRDVKRKNVKDYCKAIGISLHRFKKTYTYDEAELLYNRYK